MVNGMDVFENLLLSRRLLLAKKKNGLSVARLYTRV